MKKNEIVCLLIFILGINKSLSQNVLSPELENISNSITDYFKSERENIHIQFNKNTYLTSERIWFKGYIINQQTKLPFLSTNNVYTILYDQNGTKIKSNLHFASNGTFEGYFKLDKNISSGKYFIKAYTNYMNNYTEDESSLFEVEILNPVSKKFIDLKKVNSNEVSINFFAESGVFLEGVTNTICAKITDCNDNGIEIKNAEIIDSNGELVTTYSTNKFGYGKFDILTTKIEVYKSVFKLNDKLFEKNLPEISTTGITFSANNFSIPGKTALKIKTNLQTFKTISSTKQTLVIQQNENVNFIQFSFLEDKLEQNIILKNEEFFEGINTIHLLDSDLKKVGERLLYKHKLIANSNIDIIVSKIKNDSIIFIASTAMQNANLSVSLLPKESITEHPQKSIISSFEFDNFIVDPLKESYYYFNDLSRTKLFELDNFLMSTKSKYGWNTITQKPKENKYDFDHGLTIKGTINTELKNSESIQVNMKAIGLGINEFTSLNSKNEFQFENVLAIDSTKIYFVVLDKKGKKTEQKIFSQLINNIREFKKPFITKSSCLISIDNLSDYNLPFPKLQNTVALDSITILTRKNKLVNESKNGNFNAKGFKISDKDANSYRDILSFIGNNGFSISKANGEIRINGYLFNEPNDQINRIGPSRYGFGPAVFIDGQLIQDYSILQDYSLNNIDEIYLSRNSDVSVRGSNGTIKIYSKKSFGVSIVNNKSQYIFVKNGFQPVDFFVNPKYENVKDEGYLKWEL